MDSGTNPSYGLNMGTHNDNTAPQQTRTNPKLNFTKNNLQQFFLSVHAVYSSFMYRGKSWLWDNHGQTPWQNSPTTNGTNPKSNFTKKKSLQQRFLPVHAVDPKLMYGFWHKSLLWNKHGHTRRQNSLTTNEKKPKPTSQKQEFAAALSVCSWCSGSKFHVWILAQSQLWNDHGHTPR